MSTRRSRLAIGGSLLVAGLLLSACTSTSSSSDGGVVTVISNTTVAGAPSSTGAPSSVARTTAKAGASSKPSASSAKPSASPQPSASAVPSSAAGGAQPDGFVPTKLKPGEKPPQFIVVSFDGVGWHEKWQYWKSIEDKVPFHFTGFLSGTYMLSSTSDRCDGTSTCMKYQGPGHSPGKSSISFNRASDLPVEIDDLNDAIARGDEIGTHFNGHFCSGADPSGNDWNTGDWNNELDQFFGFVKNVDANNSITDKLNISPGEIKGERTPCLEGHAEDLFPALKAHGMTYDSSFTKHGISWPTKSKDNGIWQIGMAEFPIHGTLPDGSPVDPGERTAHFQITMDYNFWYSQRNTSTGTPDQSAADSAQVQATYQDMYNAAYNGNRAPLILGNHFNAWNNNAYSDAIGNFVLQTCGKPNTLCLPFRDLIAWMQVQDPARLAQLQAEGAEVQAP